MERLKVLFLDFDGVLNSLPFLRRYTGDGVGLDPACMALLQHIVESTGAVIVLSTSWREYWNRVEAECDPIGCRINEVFREYGLTVWDKTPQLRQRREEEIQTWLEAHEAEVAQFAVVDDTLLGAPFLSGHFVKTVGYTTGLDQSAAEQVIAILNEII